MVMMNRKLLVLSALTLFALQVTAQTNNYGIWYEAGASYKIIKGLKAEVSGSLRTDENASHIESFYFQGGLNYKIVECFSVGAFYRLIEKEEDDNAFHPRHRWFVELNGELPVNRFTLSARYRFQQQTKTYIEDPEDDQPGYYNRVKLKLDFDVPKIPLEPFISAEAFSQTFASNGIMIEKTRLGGGLAYNVIKKHKVSVEYIYQKSEVSKPEKFNIIAIGYSVKL